MGKVKSKRIYIRLPEDHFVFQIEDGRRSEYIRLALDQYQNIERLERKIDQVISLLLAQAPKDNDNKDDKEIKEMFGDESFIKNFFKKK